MKHIKKLEAYKKIEETSWEEATERLKNLDDEEEKQKIWKIRKF